MEHNSAHVETLYSKFLKKQHFPSEKESGVVLNYLKLQSELLKY